MALMMNRSEVFRSVQRVFNTSPVTVNTGIYVLYLSDLLIPFFSIC